MNDVELEAHRQRMLNDLGDTPDTIMPRSAGPGSFACHEALHMTSYFASAIDGELCLHPSILTNPDWFRLAMEAQEKLAELYAAIGKVHLPADNPNHSGSA